MATTGRLFSQASHPYTIMTQRTRMRFIIGAEELLMVSPNGPGLARPRFLDTQVT